MRECLLVAALAVVGPGCRGGVEVGERGPTTKHDGTGDAADPCGAAALGLAGAATLAPWKPPAGCTSRGDGGGHLLVRDVGQLRQRLACDEGAAVDVDFSRQALLAASYTLTPAGAGLAAFDDGKVVTLATRHRTTCPDEPLPMPLPPTTIWFVVPGGGERSVAGTTCTVPTTCP